MKNQQMPSEGMEDKKMRKKKEKNNKSQMQQEDDSSEWSLQSLQDLKALNIKDLEEQEFNSEPKQKQKKSLQVAFPQKPNVFANAALHEIGKVHFIVGQLLIVQSSNSNFVVDLDNWISDHNKNLIGFVIDVLGRIQKPFYAVKLEQSTNLNEWIGKSLFYIEGSSKILKDEDIKSLQSKSAAEVEEPIDDSSDQQQFQKPQRKYSDDRRNKREPAWNRQRRNRFDERNHEESRDRTRERQQVRNTSRSRNHNQRYLESMYTAHYNQMMQLYGNNQFQPNTMQAQQNIPSFFGNTQPQPQPQPQLQNQFNPLQMQVPPQNFSHQSIAQFGSSSHPQQFYGQSIFQNPGWNNNNQNSKQQKK